MVLPKIGVSDSIRWIAKGKSLYVPFIEIKGVGEKMANQLTSILSKSITKKASNSGFFYKQSEIVLTEKTNKLTKILEDINNCIAIGDIKKLQSYFSFNIKIPSANIPENSPKLNLQIIQKVDLIGLDKCYSCQLGRECEYGPVSPSIGKYNIMIIGEAPGKDEDKQGLGFVGSAGQLLWKEMLKYDLKRETFYVTNICKCFPKITKTPKQDSMDKCFQWLHQEIIQVKPTLVLAFGNTSLKGLKSKYVKITEANGKIEQNEFISSRIYWCIHPSAVLHNPNNYDLFSEGILNFSKVINKLGV